MARILSIEDDPDVQHLLGLALHQEGYEIHYAFTGPEGYEKVLSLNPDIVLLDMMLPGWNGVEVLRRVRANKAVSDVPVIVVTAYSEDPAFVEGSLKTLGIVEYIRKPLVLDDLLRLIRRVLADRKPRGSVEKGLRKGVVRLDPKLRTVWVNDRLVATLAERRFSLLKALLESRGAVGREDLLKRVWGNSTEINVLEKTIQRLREDLGTESARVQTTSDGYELIG